MAHLTSGKSSTCPGHYRTGQTEDGRQINGSSFDLPLCNPELMKNKASAVEGNRPQ
jgi:hypothetical protein